MKRLIAFIICAMQCLSTLGISGQAASLEMGWGGGSGETWMMMDTAPFISNGRTFLPIRYVAETFGIFTTWDINTRTVTLERGDIVVRLTVGSKIMRMVKSGVEISVEMDVAPMLRDGRTCLPIRFVADAFELIVEWQESFRQEYSDGRIYMGKVVVSEGIKEAHLIIGDKTLLVLGRILSFHENEYFRFAYPSVPAPEFFDSESNLITIFVPADPWSGVGYIIKVTYSPMEDTPFYDIDAEEIMHWGETDTQLALLITIAAHRVVELTATRTPAFGYRYATVDGFPSIIYMPDRYRANDEEAAVVGVVFFHNNILMCIEVSATLCPTAGIVVGGEWYMEYAARVLAELLPSVRMK